MKKYVDMVLCLMLKVRQAQETKSLEREVIVFKNTVYLALMIAVYVVALLAVFAWTASLSLC